MPMSVWPDSRIFLIKVVTTITLQLACVFGRWALTPHDVLDQGNGLKVKRVEAAPIPTQVV
jgi:hypothetical protein